MKAYAAHYGNKHPGGTVEYDDSKLTAFDHKGRKRVHLVLGGNGDIVDRSKEVGALDSHCLSPIPKNSRAMKLYKDGTIGESEEHAERLALAKAIAVDGKVLSIDEYKKMPELFQVDGDIVTKKVKS
jgi:hypothetical protein